MAARVILGAVVILAVAVFYYRDRLSLLAAGYLPTHATASATSAKPEAGPPAWILYAVTDPVSGVVTQRAQLLAQAAPDQQNLLELRATGSTERHATITLSQATPAQCQTIHTIGAHIDGSDIQSFDVTSTVQANGCHLEVADYPRFLAQIRYANTLDIPTSSGHPIHFAVTGLVWNAD
jgi:hypothetical protein